MNRLDPNKPSKALGLYLADQQDSLAETSVNGHRSRLNHFIDWLGDQGIDNLNELTGRLVKEYQLHAREERGLAPAT